MIQPPPPGFRRVVAFAIEFESPSLMPIEIEPTMILPPTRPKMWYRDLFGNWHDCPAGSTITTDITLPGGQFYVDMPEPQPMQMSIYTQAFEEFGRRARATFNEFARNNRMWNDREPLEGTNADLGERTGLVPVDYGEPLEDGSPELIAWLESRDGCKWSQGFHHVIQHHAVIELYDDMTAIQLDAAGNEVAGWDNSKYVCEFVTDYVGGSFDMEASWYLDEDMDEYPLDPCFV